MLTWLKWIGIGLLAGAAGGVLVASGILDVIMFFDPKTRPSSRRHLFDWNSEAEYRERFLFYPICFAICGAVVGGAIGWQKMREERTAVSGESEESSAKDAPPKA